MSKLRVVGALWASLILLLTTAGSAVAAAPANDEASGATPLRIGVSLEFDSTDATTAASDPDDCDGSHGAFAGPYYASVWFSYTATNRDHALSLSAPTMQGDADDFLAITFVYAQTSNGLELIDCTAYGNDAEWEATPGTTYLIMEAGLDSAVTEEPPFSDKGGHGTITLHRVAADGHHYAWTDFFTYSDCGLVVEGSGYGSGQFRLKKGRNGDPTPYYVDNYEWHIVSRNPANGKWFREDGNALYKDLKIVNVEGTIYTFQAQETGRPFSLTTMDGERIFFDRGRLLTTFTVDTKGDDDLNNDEFIDGTFALLKDSGAHPGWHFDGDWCEDIVIPLLGD